ncbi:bifunctional allantoicase/(S)-ureidoglycine aminohydrolase [Paracoccus seriniphilus]|uniref:(S)-ureidoglycine aminohydrolase n=1 Tax=Paracoccus seriniphilus TaxID=184748 RepID=A0A239PWT4_9RHOB|nr:bifunctional allantoicase/(S)-ureidoglycine aminohydrolase [Paracoccus seriniphilus]WCR13359.1 (S)-ureidoglycine aminohydrolase [Paracoccus seriniphilus]SNT74396.1 (S)-ureidoglycine aminohydrolase [Paracoccus seriniphilus]
MTDHPPSDRPRAHPIPAYAGPLAGLPPQRDLTTDTAVFTEAYAVIPRSVMRDIVTSYLPHWQGMRMWVLARPLTGFAETFSQYIVELSPGGGSDMPDDDPQVQHAIFVTVGAVALWIAGQEHLLEPGGFAYVPPGTPWKIRNGGSEPAGFHWWRKRWQPSADLARPDPIILREQDITPAPMPDTDGAWATTRFMDPDDLRHDMHITLVSFEPGGSIPFAETHVMEHGLFVLEGKAVYRLNRDWVEVGPGDFMWLRAFCPQACYAGGPGRFRYLLYKDVNRHASLWPNR